MTRPVDIILNGATVLVRSWSESDTVTVGYSTLDDNKPVRIVGYYASTNLGNWSIRADIGAASFLRGVRTMSNVLVPVSVSVALPLFIEAANAGTLTLLVEQ